MSRGALPHNDLPEFKVHKFKRYIGPHESFLWFKDSYSHEYHVTLRQNHLRGPRGAMVMMIKTLVLGVLVPACFIVAIKRYAHNSYHYFNAKVGSIIYLFTIYLNLFYRLE